MKSLTYFKLRKIKKMIAENQQSLEAEKEFSAQMTLMQVHKELKSIERDLTNQLGTVIMR
jgi:DNA primase